MNKSSLVKRQCFSTLKTFGFWVLLCAWPRDLRAYRFRDPHERLAGPWHDEFRAEWEKGKLARALPGLVFHPEDLTYSHIKCV